MNELEKGSGARDLDHDNQWDLRVTQTRRRVPVGGIQALMTGAEAQGYTRSSGPQAGSLVATRSHLCQ